MERPNHVPTERGGGLGAGPPRLHLRRPWEHRLALGLVDRRFGRGEGAGRWRVLKRAIISSRVRTGSVLSQKLVLPCRKSPNTRAAVERASPCAALRPEGEAYGDTANSVPNPRR